MAITYYRCMKVYGRRITGQRRLYLLVLAAIFVTVCLFVTRYERSRTTSYKPPDCFSKKTPPDCFSKKTPLSLVSNKPSNSMTPRIKFFPKKWTGETVDISKDFDPQIFDNFCQTYHLRAVLPIYSTVDNFEKRKLLRESLGLLAEKLGCRIFFIVGMSGNTETNKRLLYEYLLEKDILVIGKIDTYRDLNNKAAAMVEWIDDYCLNVPYVIHLIDDAYVNLERWLQSLEEIPDLDYMLGTWTDTPTERRSWLYKSYVTLEEYPYPRFPIYAYGFAFAFPSRTATRLRSSMYNATYCWIEDVWIAGHVREAAGVKLIPLKDGEWGQGNWTCRRNQTLHNFIMFHTVDVEDLKKEYQCSL